MIELRNIYKCYGSNKNINNFHIDDLSMKINNGSVTGLLGVNGAGKTTIIKAICGCSFPDKGSILIDNTDIEQAPKEIMKHIGYVPETPQLPVNMFVYDFLNYAGEIHGLYSNKLTEALDYVIKECSLEHFLYKKIKCLSKGQKQRVSFAQAIIHNPSNLILDEPISGLDPAQIIQIRNLITKLAKKKAILMSTHILQEVYSLCSVIYIMNNGNIVGQGTETDILKSTNTNNLEEAFLNLSNNSLE